MRMRAIRALVHKDLLAVRRARGVMLPLLLVPLLLLVLLPLGIGLGLTYAPVDESELAEISRFLEHLPPAMAARLDGLSPRQQFTYVLLGYLIAPMFLVVPLMVSSVIAADSFAGEKERGTLEALLYTPTTDRELFLAKSIAAWVPAALVSVLGMVAYCATANLASWPVMGRLWLPNTTWILLSLWVAPAAAGVGLGFTVVVSARVKTLQEAFQLGGLVVLPVVALMLGQLGGLLYLSAPVVFGLGVVLWAVVVLLLRLGGNAFSRAEVLARR